MHRIVLATRIAAPAERCFDLARSVDLHLRSTAATEERAIAGVTRGLLRLGDEVTWRARHFGRVQELASRITQFDRPRSFVDEMTRGPFRRLRHVHAFAEEPGGTCMTDDLAFEVPFGPLGALAGAVLVAPHLRQLLLDRNAFLKRVAESEEWRTFLEPRVDGPAE